MTWLYLSAIFMVLTALTHSLVGERRLIGPLLAIDDPLTRNPLARQVVRFAWHFTSVLMLLCAVIVLYPFMYTALIALIGMVWLAVGLFDAIYTRGKHIGWPILTLAGASALIGVLR